MPGQRQASDLKEGGLQGFGSTLVVTAASLQQSVATSLMLLCRAGSFFVAGGCSVY